MWGMAFRAHDTTKDKPVNLGLASGPTGASVSVNYRLTTKHHRLDTVESDRNALTITVDGSTIQLEDDRFLGELDRVREEQAGFREIAAERLQGHREEQEAQRRAAADSLPTAFTDALGEERWQYAVVSTGTFNTGDRLQRMLAHAGEAGWELVTVYDKSSNWLAGLEKGFMLMKRPVPAGSDPHGWCVVVRG